MKDDEKTQQVGVSELICRQLEFFAGLGVTHLALNNGGQRSGRQEVPVTKENSTRVAVIEGSTATAPGSTEGLADAGLVTIREELGECARCKLSPSRKQIVFGAGDPAADLMFVGEAPGEEEDRQGIPFVGAAGQLLTKIIGAMGLSRDQVYIANILKCRPPRNRNPEPDEVAACQPFLLKQIASIQPKVIVALGKYAAQTLLETDEMISRIRGRFFEYQGRLLMPTFHPSYLLRNPSAKRLVWEDVQGVMKKLGELGSGLYPELESETTEPGRPGAKS